MSDREGNPEIYTADMDGGNAQRLTNHPGRDEFPAWSPDGTRLAFMKSSQPCKAGSVEPGDAIMPAE